MTIDDDDDDGPLMPLPEQLKAAKVESTLEKNDIKGGNVKPTSRFLLSPEARIASGIPSDSGEPGRGGEQISSMMSDLPPSKRRISTRDLNFGIPSNMAAQEHVDETHGIDSMKASALRFLHQKWVQILLLLLLALDIIILFAELLLLGVFPSCQIVVRDCISCCPGSHTDPVEGGERWLSVEEDHGEEICEAGYQATGEPSCDEHKWQVVHAAELGMFWTTICILSIFMVEILVEMWALSPSIFFRQCFYTMDFIVILVSLVLELMFHFFSRVWAEELAGFVIFFRLWRFVRIGHGIVEVTSELTHEVYEELLEYAAQCEDVIQANGLNLPETTKHVHKMVDDRDEDRHE
jgi:Ion transport protein